MRSGRSASAGDLFGNPSIWHVHFGDFSLCSGEAMRDFAGQADDGGAGRSIHRGVHFPRSRPCCSGMRLLAEQIDHMGRRLLRRHESQSRCKLDGAMDGGWEMADDKRREGKAIGVDKEEVAKVRDLITGAGCSSSAMGCTCSPLPFWFSITLYISLPLRRASICGHLRFGSVEPNHLRPDGRQGAYPALQCGHENGPAGHLAAAFSGLSDAFFGLDD
jgi:hypothetical protein